MHSARSTSIAAVIAGGLLAAGLGVAASAGTAARHNQHSPDSQHPTGPPVIHESFTLLACNEDTTIGEEGCSEHKIISLDHRIDVETSIAYHLLQGKAPRRDLDAAAAAWLAYRSADCTSQADVYAGGTEEPVAYAMCEVRSDAARLADVDAFVHALRSP
jgi:uncharacterized protein YecT (DUF1311 family)